jgi:hypothetical protein
MELPFNEEPVLKKFFLSHDGKHILIYLKNIEENRTRRIFDTIKILSLTTLEVVDTFTLTKSDFELIEPLSPNNQLVDSSLVWKSQFIYL